jgi:hypothetical protein
MENEYGKRIWKTNMENEYGKQIWERGHLCKEQRKKNATVEQELTPYRKHFKLQG